MQIEISLTPPVQADIPVESLIGTYGTLRLNDVHLFALSPEGFSSMTLDARDRAELQADVPALAASLPRIEGSSIPSIRLSNDAPLMLHFYTMNPEIEGVCLNDALLPIPDGGLTLQGLDLIARDGRVIARFREDCGLWHFAGKFFTDFCLE